MMRAFIFRALAVLVLLAGALPAHADLTYTQGAGTTIFDFTCFTTKHCTAGVVVNSAGTEIFTSSNPAQVTGANGTFPATQSGTWAVTANPTTAANWGVGATSASVPANGVLGMMSNSGTAVALQGDGTNGLWVNIKAGGGSGGTSLGDGSTFTEGSTNFTPVGGEYVVSPTNCVTTKGCTVAMTIGRSMHVLEDNSATISSTLSSINAALAGPILAQAATAWNTNGPFTSATNNAVMADLRGALWVDHGAWAGTQLGTPTNFGTTPGAVIAGSVNSSQFQGTTAVAPEPCQTGTKTFVRIPAISTATTTTLVTNSGGKVIYVCHMFLNSSVAEGVSVVDGTTGGSCAAGIDALVGDTTANTTTTGLQLAANEGWSIGVGSNAVLATASGKDLCLVSGSTGQIRGSLVVVQQ